MPTGYTEKIAKGIGFEDFVLNCARAFGALVSLREESQDTPIPDEINPSDYYKNALNDAINKLNELESMSIEDAAKAARLDYAKESNFRDQSTKDRLELRKKYESMLEKVKSWMPPSEDHYDLKKFMISQIEESIDFDCRDYILDVPVLVSGEQYIENQKIKCLHDIDYFNDEYIKEVQRCAERTEWIQQLKASLRRK